MDSKLKSVLWMVLALDLVIVLAAVARYVPIIMGMK